MAFNLGGILAGASDAIVRRIEDEEERQEKLADEERSIATRQRLARETERRKKQAVLDETAGMMAMLGYDENTIQSILEKGTSAAQFAVTAGQTAMQKGVDPNTIWNFSTNEAGETDMDAVTETIEAAAPTRVGDIEATSEEAPDLPTGTMSGGVVNLEVYQNLFADPKPVEKSIDGALTRIGLKMARTNDPDEIAQLEKEEEVLLKRLANRKAAEKTEDGTTTPSLTASTVNTMERNVRSKTLQQFKFKLGVDDEIENMTDGNRHLFHVSEIATAKELNARNKDINDPYLKVTAQTVRASAVEQLESYGYDKLNEYGQAQENLRALTAQNADTQTINAAQKALDNINYFQHDMATAKQKMNARSYKIGDVVNVEGELFVYTGVIDYVTGKPLIKIGDIGA